MKNIMLLGNPNTGKTTLYNILTKQNDRAGNWHGLTVQAKTKEFKLFETKSTVLVSDLPGIYSLNGYSFEEKLTIKHLQTHSEDAVIYICDSINLKRNLKLGIELLNSHKQIILLINQIPPFRVEQYLEELSKILGVHIFVCNFHKRREVEKTFKQIFSILSTPTPQNKIINHKTSKTTLLTITHKDTLNKLFPKKRIKLNPIEKLLINKFTCIPTYLFFILLTFAITFGELGNIIAFGLKYIFIDILADKILLLGIQCNAPIWMMDLMQNGIFLGIGTIFSFLPQMLLLLFCFNFMEDVGIFSYLAYSLDGILKKCGLSGKVVFSLILSYGCNTTAVTTTRNLSTLSQRKRTIMLLPYYACSATLPIMLSLTALLFNEYKILIMFSIYLLGIMISLLVAIIINMFSKDKRMATTYKSSYQTRNTIISNNNNQTPTSQTCTNSTTINNTSDFILEMPRLRFPSLKKQLKDSFNNLKEFSSKFITVIIVACVSLWFLLSFSPTLVYIGSNSTNSILQQLSFFISPIFSPLGFATTACIAGIIASLVAKELTLSIMAIISQTAEINTLASLGLSIASGTSFLVFIFLCSPCIICMWNIKKELGTKMALKVGLSSTITAYIASYIIYNSIKSYMFLIISICFAIVFAIMISTVVKYIRKQNCVNCVNTCKMHN